MEIKDLWRKIEQYDRIIIHRHSRPDLDALGSQRGLAEILKTNYPQKEIYIVGDMSSRYAFLGEMDVISNEMYSEALVIITDVAVSAMVSDDRYRLAKEVVIIDHHKNPSDITDQVLCDPTRIAVSEWIAQMAMNQHLKINKTAATSLYGGIVTDSGRFQYGETSGRTLKIAGELLDLGADKEFIYTNIYTETLKERQMKNWFANRFEVTKNGVGYLKNDRDVFEKWPVDFFNISRGMVGVMAGIEEISIWCNFTLDMDNNIIVGEFRSRSISIVDIAKKYGGGGHDLACGASLKSWDEVDLVLADFDQLLGDVCKD